MKKVKANLISIYDARASFYGKAQIARAIIAGVRGYMLYSYGTPVAFGYIEHTLRGKYHEIMDPNTGEPIDVNHPGWSQTTNRHIREFCKQFRAGYIDNIDDEYSKYNLEWEV